MSVYSNDRPDLYNNLLEITAQRGECAQAYLFLTFCIFQAVRIQGVPKLCVPLESLNSQPDWCPWKLSERVAKKPMLLNPCMHLGVVGFLLGCRRYLSLFLIRTMSSSANSRSGRRHDDPLAGFRFVNDVCGQEVPMIVATCETLTSSVS